MVSYRLEGDPFDFDLDYIDYSTSIKVQKGVKYPTWKMSSTVGVAFGSLFKELEIVNIEHEDYFLNAIAKRLQPYGLLCYQDPSLLKPNAPKVEEPILEFPEVFRFIWSEVAAKWVYFFFIAKIHFEKKWMLADLVRAYAKRKSGNSYKLNQKRRPAPIYQIASDIKIDVLIPSLGREEYVEQFLNDLKSQSIVPTKIIIVEQEKEMNAGCQMAFLTEKDWPFEIKHIFSRRSGACYARNEGLGYIESEWVFLADDDIRIQPDFFKQVLSQLLSMRLEAATVSCLQKDQKETHEQIHQTRIFGAGCSMVKKHILDSVRFDLAYEFGYAEDSDFGAQIRNLGHDVVYLPNPTILHLKAPVGGFREPVTFPWNTEDKRLKPSPTVMLFWYKHFSEKQFLGNKLMIFINFLLKMGKKNPYAFLSKFNKDWDLSLQFAKKLQSGQLQLIKTNE
nr:glycosyltransferase family A protein [Algoriphagus sp. AGSA1]